MPVTLTFRDAGAWGAGKGTPLTVAEIDGNWWAVKQAVEALQDLSFTGESIETITVTGAAMDIWGSQGTHYGTFALPATRLAPRGDWVSGQLYQPQDLVRVNGVPFLCLSEHTAAPWWWTDQRLGAWQLFGGARVPSPSVVAATDDPAVFEVPSGAPFVPGAGVQAVSDDGTLSLGGTVTDFAADGDGVWWLTVAVTETPGAGDAEGWQIAVAGASGPQGPQGAPGLTVPRGDWQPGATYAEGDVVVGPGGHGYHCLTAHTAGSPFAGDKWERYVEGATALGPAVLTDLGPLTPPTPVFAGEGSRLRQVDLARGATRHDLGGLT